MLQGNNNYYHSLSAEYKSDVNYRMEFLVSIMVSCCVLITHVYYSVCTALVQYSNENECLICIYLFIIYFSQIGRLRQSTIK